MRFDWTREALRFSCRERTPILGNLLSLSTCCSTCLVLIDVHVLILVGIVMVGRAAVSRPTSRGQSETHCISPLKQINSPGLSNDQVNEPDEHCLRDGLIEPSRVGP